MVSDEIRAQQNVQFTQYIFNSMSVNPAYTGYKEEWFGQLGLRSQWVGLEGAPQTGLLSIDGIVDPVNKRHGLGMQITADKLGPQSATSASANYETGRASSRERVWPDVSISVVAVPLNNKIKKLTNITTKKT